jgi:hypothetical protein
VRINDSEGNALTSVYLGLSDDEAEELIVALTTLKSARAGWHEHISDETYQLQVTVYRENDETTICPPNLPSRGFGDIGCEGR